MRTLAVILMLIPLTCHAAEGDISLLVNGKAIHFGTLKGVEFNERNHGLGLQYELEAHSDWRPFLAASWFEDSMHNTSGYAGGGALTRVLEVGDYHADVGAIAFLMTRKDYRDGRPFPGVLPALAVGTDRVAVQAAYVPSVHPKTVPFLFFQLRIALPSGR